MNTRLRHIQNWQDLAVEANWSVKEMARLCKVSVRALELYFGQTKAKTPKRWLTEQRLRQAKEDLQKGFSVKETAEKLAYKHAQHLSRDFKRHWGICPTGTCSRHRKFRILV